MRFLLPIGLFALLTAGCAWNGKKAEPPPQTVQPATPVTPAVSPGTPTSPTNPIVTPDTGLSGRVAFVNARSHYVVVSFPPGEVAEVDQVLDVYRNGLKVGVIKITGPKRDFNIAADILEGECRRDDEVRRE